MIQKIYENGYSLEETLKVENDSQFQEKLVIWDIIGSATFNIPGRPKTFKALRVRHGRNVYAIHSKDKKKAKEVIQKQKPDVPVIVGKAVAVTASLSFNGTPYTCTIPYDSIYSLVSQSEGKHYLFADSLPEEIAVGLAETQAVLTDDEQPDDSTLPAQGHVVTAKEQLDTSTDEDEPEDDPPPPPGPPVLRLVK